MPDLGIGRTERPACSVRREAVPEVRSCEECGEDIEVWADEQETVSSGCGTSILICRQPLHGDTGPGIGAP